MMRDSSLIERLDGRLAEVCSGSSVTILSHWGGDADSVGSAYVLSKLLRGRYGASSTGFRIPDSPTSHARAIMAKLGFEESEPEKTDLYIAVDVGSLEQLGEMRDKVLSSGVPILLMDHHLHHDDSSSSVIEYFVSDRYQAVSEMVFDLAERVGWRLDLSQSTALFLGLYYDTARLSVADGETARKICQLLSGGIVPNDVLAGLETVMEESERIARILSASRMKVYRMGDWVMAFSEVGAYQSSSSRALLGVGAHLALVGGQEGDIANISLRATGEFVTYTGLGMGDSLVKIVLSRFEGSGGGHRTVARLRCRGRLEEIYQHVIHHLSLRLGVQPVKLAE